MSTKPRTIDQMGIDASSRYARDQSQLNTTLIQESRYIPQKAEISVLKPYMPAEFDHYLTPNKVILWAAFPPPPTYNVMLPLFTHQLIPSLGSLEKQEADLEKVQALEDSLSKPHKERKHSSDEENEEDDEKTRRLQYQEARVVLNLLQTINKFDRVLASINARRNQYQRG